MLIIKDGNFHHVYEIENENNQQPSCFPPHDFQSALTHVEDCTNEIKSWMTKNMLKPNPDKIKTTLAGHHRYYNGKCWTITKKK